MGAKNTQEPLNLLRASAITNRAIIVFPRPVGIDIKVF
ncbi:hypothetical protein HRbin06_01010 [archaeon HR06]|nr:hypothetical protein HRbin06_01010 [archaeon HR06]